MRLGVKTLILALVVALLAVPAAFAKGGHGGGKPSWAGGGGHGKPSWAGGGRANGHAKTDEAKADKVKGKEKKQGRAGAESELTPEDLEGLNPAWYCKTFRSMMEDDGQDFYEHFGTNPNDANGFGMCVSERAQGGDPAEGVELSNDEAACEAPADEGLSDEGTTEEGTSEDETLGDDETLGEGDALGEDGTTEEDDRTSEEGGDASEPAGDEECEAADDGASDDGASGDDSGDDLSGDDLSGDEAGADETVAAFARALVSFIRV